MATTGVNINNIGIKMIPLFNQSLITNNIFTLDLILRGRFIIKFINIFY